MDLSETFVNLSIYNCRMSLLEIWLHHSCYEQNNPLPKNVDGFVRNFCESIYP